MKKAALISVFLMLGSLALAQDNVVAIVGNKKITIEEFNKKFNEVKSQTINPPTKELFLEEQNQPKATTPTTTTNSLNDLPSSSTSRSS